MLGLQQVLLALALALPLVYIFRGQLLSSSLQRRHAPTKSVPKSENVSSGTAKSIMQPPSADLAPPKDDPFTQAQLKDFDGSDAAKPIYVAIKGTVFDVTRKADTYGKGKSYNLFAGRDASKALGKSSLKEEDAIPTYDDLAESELKTLNDWHDFFSKRYNIVGKVVDLPSSAAVSPSVPPSSL